MKIVIKYFCFLTVILNLALVFNISKASAARLYFSPSSGNVTVGNILNTDVLVDTQGQAINNSSVVINFPTNFLEVISVSKSGSIFSLWVEEPAFSNNSGIITFDGGLPTPGYNGNAGQLLNITFRVRNAGTASLAFSSAAVRANDGYGTDILQTRDQAQFTFKAVEALLTEVLPALGTPSATKIFSSTHPDPNKWYALKDAKFTWDLSSDITGTRLLVGRIHNAIPTVTYIPAISSRELDNLEDGIWYFSVQLRNDTGWGAVSRFRFQIDTKPPEPFIIKFIDGKETQNPQPMVLFDTADSLSNLDYYKVKIGEKDFFTVDPEIVKNKPYMLPSQAPGKRTILVQAFDKAGNYQTTADEFIILPLESPIITEYPKQLVSGESLIVKGTTKYPNAQTTVWFESDSREVKSQITKNDIDGNFTLVAEEKLKDGIYKIWAEVTDERGAKSTSSEKITISIERPAFLKIGSWAISLLAVVVPLVALIFILIFIIWYGFHIFASFRKKLVKIKKEVREAESALHKAFDLLKDDIGEQIKLLEKTKTKRQLTKEEEKIIKRLRDDLDSAEKFVRKEIGDIDKEIKGISES